MTPNQYRAAIKDFGNGFYVERRKLGSYVWYVAMQLDAPDGYTVGKRHAKFGYKRDAVKQVQDWKASDS